MFTYKELIAIIVFIFTVNSLNSNQWHRLNYVLSEAYDVEGVSRETHYYYDPSSFFKCDSLYEIVGNDEGHYYYGINVQTQVTVCNDTTQIETQYESQYGSMRHTVTVLDSLKRLIGHKYFNSDNNLLRNQRIYYSTNSQPDSMIFNNEKWVFHYDNMGRKSTIDYYQYNGNWVQYNGNWVFKGYYTLSFTEPLPYSLDLYTLEKTYDYDMRVLFDSSWKFSRIVFCPLQSEPDTLNWQLVGTNPVTFRNYRIIYLNEIEEYFISFYVNGLIRSIILNNWSSYWGEHDTYHWDSSEVPNEDEIISLTSHLAIINYPNPFSKSTTIKYNLAKKGLVSLKIYNIKGQLVKTLTDNLKKAGENSEIWTGESDNHEQLSSGVYFLKLQQENEVKTSKLLYVK